MLVNLVSAMKARELRHYEVAAQAGIPETKLSRFINGRAQLSQDEMRRLAKVLDASPAWLFEGGVQIPSLSFAERVIATWKTDADLRAEFGDDFRTYVSYEEAVRDGRTRACAPSSPQGAEDGQA